jgi:hypothetical protein
MPKREPILSDYDRKVVARQVQAILLSPQGRDLGRWFLTEQGKGAAGNLGQVKQEIFDVMSESINGLYSQPVPVITGTNS